MGFIPAGFFEKTLHIQRGRKAPGYIAFPDFCKFFEGISQPQVRLLKLTIAPDQTDPVFRTLIHMPTREVPLEPKIAEASIQANTRGFRHYQRGEMSHALRQFIGALAIDPGNHLARYNAACILSLFGFYESALEQLKVLNVPNCIECMKQLKKTATDKDLAPLHALPEFRRLFSEIDKSRATQF